MFVSVFKKIWLNNKRIKDAHSFSLVRPLHNKRTLLYLMTQYDRFYKLCPLICYILYAVFATVPCPSPDLSLIKTQWRHWTRFEPCSVASAHWITGLPDLLLQVLYDLMFCIWLLRSVVHIQRLNQQLQIMATIVLI